MDGGDALGLWSLEHQRCRAHGIRPGLRPLHRRACRAATDAGHSVLEVGPAARREPNRSDRPGRAGHDWHGLSNCADDFLCRSYGNITDIHIWGSWLNDQVDPNTTFELKFWD